MNMLSGCELVAKGTSKIDATLPELGLKEVSPNGTWLEQKQVQAAIEARKKLIEVERIEKSGVLSHAVWQEELMLAEVTQKVGGHWQYLGHNVGPQLYLRPEETLFLMEINCLHLKFNNVQVSLQQAYSLLLGHDCTHQQYKVYASLSRLGYRVYRHHLSTQEISDSSTNNKKSNSNINSGLESATVTDKTSDVINVKLNEDIEGVSENVETKQKSDVEDIIMDEVKPIIEVGNNKEDIQSNNDTEIESGSSLINNNQENPRNNCCHRKLIHLKSRKLKPCRSKVIQKYFNNLPELIGTSTVIIKKPHIKYIPDNMNTKKEEYSLNLHDIRSKGVRTDTNETNIYSVGDEVNGSHIRRLSNTSNNQFENSSTYNNYRFASQNMQYRPFNMWRDRHSFNYFNFSMLFQRHFSPSFYSGPQSQFCPRNHAPPRPSLSIGNRNLNQNRKRPFAAIQQRHLESIKRLSAKFKLLVKRNVTPRNTQSLQKLIQNYNRNFKTKLRINKNFDIIEENILDTIELDDDEPSDKRRRTNEHDPNFKDNLDLIKQLASRLEDLENNDKSTGRHRRAISKLLKTFNESYNEEYCLTDNYEIKNMRQINIDTSESESDCCMNEDIPSFPKGKKVKNPFNILKRIAEKQKPATVTDASTSSDNEVVEIKKYSDVITKTFSENWLPKEDDFGRAEVVKKDCISNACVHDETDMRREKFMYDFLKLQSTKSDNWLDLKISFYQSFEQAIAEFQGNVSENQIGPNSSVGSEESSNMASVLKKLSIIKTENSINEECNLRIDFDVYTRDVQNFRKTNRPTPHFRLVVLDQSSSVPSGAEMATLESKYNDDVTIIFAIVGINSIGYIQIKPTNLPIYISNET